ncbi:MAG: leucine-rich repeat protein [Lachnospiraceae bacterium]|nr:leucine-rich repeat protein [Lachnospiraceae bacterium]
MANIFISHSTIDKALADYICNAFEERGLSCWIAPRNIVPGSEWAASITEAISEADVLFVLFSKNAMQSTQVSKEIGIADRKGKYIIPYKIDDTEPEGAYDYYLASCHWIMARPQDGDYKINELCDVICRVVEERNAQKKTEEVVAPVKEEVSQPVVTPAPQPVQKPATNPISQPVQKPATNPISQPVQKPVANPAPQQEQRLVSNAASQKASKPVAGNGTQSKKKTVSPAKKERRRVFVGFGIVVAVILCVLTVAGFGIGFLVKGSVGGTVKGFEYTVHEECVTIDKYVGEDTEVIIPDEIKGKPVTALAESVFYGCSEITSVQLPATITEIPDFAFYRCSNLKEINIPDGVTLIGQHAFEECTSLEYIELPYSVETVDNFAFNKCTSLTTVKMSPNITVIGNYAFSACDDLNSIGMPAELNYLGEMAFAYCTNLSMITIPDGVKRLSTTAFSGCDNITVYYKGEAYSKDITALVELIISQN